MLKKVLLATTAVYMTAAGSAHAEPITAALFGSIFASTLAGQIVSYAIGVAISIGVSSLLSKAQDTSSSSSGVTLNVQMGDDQPVTAIVGHYATSGRRKYIGTWGSEKKTPNAYLVDVIELGNLPVSGLANFWVDGQQVELLTGEYHSERGWPVAPYRRDGKDYLWVKFYDGTQSSADPYLVSKFGGDADRPYHSSMVGFGCPYAIVTARYNTDLFSSSPSYVFETGSIRFYDIRKDSTNGGSGSHRWGTPSTWEPSFNPVVIIYNIIRGLRWNGDVWFYGGQNLPAFRLPSSSWISAANECDRLVSLGNGSLEPAFRAGYEISGDEKPIDAIKKLAKACNARIAEVGGIFKILVGSPGSAVYAFTDDNIIITEGQSYTPFVTLDQTVNSLEATYPEPLEIWATKDAPALYYTTYQAADDNRQLAETVSLETVPFPLQVQRLMRAMLNEERRFRSHRFFLPPEAYALEPNDVVSYTSERNGYASKKFLVTQIEGQQSCNQFIYLQEIDPSDYDWSSSFELPVTTGWTGRITVPAQIIDGWEVQPATIYDAEAVARRPSILVKCADEQDDVRNVRVQVRLAGSPSVTFDSDAITYEAPYEWILNGTFLPNTEYQVRGKFVPFSSRPTDWSDWLSVVTPNVKLTAEDVFVDVDLTGIGEILSWTTSTAREMIEQVRSIIDMTDEAAMAAYTDRQEMRREMTSSYQDITASYNEAIVAATGPGSAIVVKIEELEASVNDTIANAITSINVRVDEVEGGVSALAERTDVLYAAMGGGEASVNVMWTASAAPSGYSARYGVVAAVEGDGDYRSASFYLDVPNSGGKTRVVMQADQIVMTDGTNLKQPFVFQSNALYLDECHVNELSALSSNLGTVTAGLIQSTNGKMVINLNAGTIVISS